MYAWLKLLVGVRKLRNRDSRLRWVRTFAWRLGRLKGSLKYRVFAP